MSSVGKQIRLCDGRALGYAEYGDTSGKPVFLFPGTPSSRLMHPPEGPTSALGVRLIVVERPGFGLSDFQPRRTLLDWPDDVMSLADALRLACFTIVGISAGGPYAAACAYKIGPRLTRAAIVSGVGPVDVPGAMQEMPRLRRLGAAIARHVPWLLRPVLWLYGNPRRDPGQFLARMVAGSSNVDRARLLRVEMRLMLLESYLEATRAGVRGFAREAVIMSRPWGFRLDAIAVPVYLWHGEEDANVSLSAARYVAGAIPGCRAMFLPGEGHWLFLDRWEEILSVLSS